MTTRTPQWHDGRKAGVKFAVEWIHRRAAELNDPGAKAAMNVAANDLGREGKHGFYETDGVSEDGKC